MSTGSLRGVLALAFLVGCGGPKRKDVPPAPAWRIEDGRLDAQLQLVDTLLDGGSPEAALNVIRQMKSEGADSVELDVAQGRALRELGLLEDARLLLEETADKHSRHADAHAQLGVLHMDLKDVDAAIEAFERALKIDPDDPDLHNNLGFALLTAGRADEAVGSLREALRLDGTRIRTRNNLGYALVAAGDDGEALRVFQAASPPADAFFQLGIGLEMRGDSSAASEAYTEALRLDPNHSRSREALDRLVQAAGRLSSPPATGGTTESP